MEDYSQLVRNVVQPKVMETVFTRTIAELERVATVDNKLYGGELISVPIRTSVSSNASDYTRADVDPASGTFVATKATWTKLYQHTAAEVSGIDLSEAKAGGGEAIANLIADAIMMESDQLKQLIFDDVIAQWKLDIDSTGTYGSNSALSRTTYATLASHENSTDTPITLALLRTMSNTTRLNKKCGPKSGYQMLMETAVYERFEPLASALHMWAVQSQLGGKDLGYQPIRTWEEQRVESPQGMTTGDIFYGRKQDFKIHTHRSLEIEQVPSGRDSAKFVMRTGVNGYVINPGFCAKYTSKD